MRTLSITRKKSFVACLAKFKVYVEDHNESELVICGVPCKKMGDLKNGATFTCEIGEQALKVFVIADNASKDYCNDCYVLDEGTEDVILTGQCKFNPTAGNPYRFDNNYNYEAQQIRKKGSKKGLVIFIIVFVVSFIVGFIIGLQ